MSVIKPLKPTPEPSLYPKVSLLLLSDKVNEDDSSLKKFQVAAASSVSVYSFNFCD